jgi:hypothetical protein
MKSIKIFAFLLLCILHFGCTQHFNIVYDGNDIAHYGGKTSITLSTKSNRFLLQKTFHPNAFIVYSGYLIEFSHNEYELTSKYNPSSIKFPAEFFEDTIQVEGIRIDISNRIPFDRVFINDTLYLDSISQNNNGGKEYYNIIVKESPKSIQIASHNMLDALFQRYNICYQSIKYDIPKTCNHVVIDAIDDEEYPIGIPNLNFDSDKMKLFSDTNEIQLNQSKNKLTRNIKRANNQILRQKW